MNLADLKPSLTELSDREATNLVLTIRNNRHRPRAETRKKSRTETTKTDLKAMLSKMSKEQLEALTKKLEEEVGTD